MTGRSRNPDKESHLIGNNSSGTTNFRKTGSPLAVPFKTKSSSCTDLFLLAGAAAY